MDLLPRGFPYSAKQWLREGCLGKPIHAASLGAKGSQPGLSTRAEGSLLFSCALEVSSQFLSLGSHQGTLLGVRGDEEQIRVMTVPLCSRPHWSPHSYRGGWGEERVESQIHGLLRRRGQSSGLARPGWAWPAFLPSFLLIPTDPPHLRH